MSEPTVAYPLRDVLTRIEAKVDAHGTEIHKMQVALARSSATVVADAATAAASRAKAAVWVAAGSLALGVAAVVVSFAGH